MKLKKKKRIKQQNGKVKFNQEKNQENKMNSSVQISDWIFKNGEMRKKQTEKNKQKNTHANTHSVVVFQVKKKIN